MTAFDQLGLVTLRTRGGVNRPSVAYDAATACYVVSWTGDDGRPYVAQTHDIEAAAGSNEPLDVARAVRSQETRYADDCGIPNAIPGNVVAITAVEAKRLDERFGRIRNVGACVPTQYADATQRGEAARNAILKLNETRAELVYSDGSQSARAVDWDEAQIEAVAQEAAEGTFGVGQTRTIEAESVRRSTPCRSPRSVPTRPYSHGTSTANRCSCSSPPTIPTAIVWTRMRPHPHAVARRGFHRALSDEAGGRAREIDLLKCGDLNSEGRRMTGASGLRSCM